MTGTISYVEDLSVIDRVMIIIELTKLMIKEGWVS